MSTSLLRDAGLVCVVALVGAYIFQARTSDLPEGSVTEVTTAPVQAQPVRQPVMSATTLTLYRERGQFWTTGNAGFGDIDFLVDTGASVVALNLADAREAGISEWDLQYTATVSTANGQTRGAPVTLPVLTVGPITQRNVRAIVLENGLEHSLLGMSFLGGLQSFTASGDTLTLTL